MAIALAPQTFAGTWLKTVAAAQKVAKEKNQLILVDMFAQWCGWCHKFEREVFPSKQFQDATSDIVLLRLDTEDGKEGSQMAKKFGINSLPTFLLLTPDLTAAGMIRGYAPPDQFVQMLKETRTKHTQFLNRVKNEPKLAKDYIQRLELAKDFNARVDYKNGEVRLRKLATEKGVPAAIRDEALYQLALAYVMQNNYAEARKAIAEVTKLSKYGESVERAHLLLGQIYLQEGNLAGARDQFRKFKETYPESPLNRNIDMVLPDLEKRLSPSK
ncbi:MAG TPA: thioredoxin fold domain-containing protein [Thermoanaerobaculia bacterium]|nr:thioredoxin fold domain-containing protein [Thermoanaerobaculia bacterium]